MDIQAFCKYAKGFLLDQKDCYNSAFYKKEQKVKGGAIASLQTRQLLFFSIEQPSHRRCSNNRRYGHEHPL
jgi:hypothetical protein